MNKRNREQLRASIARDLVQGQGGNSPTRDLLRQYVPLGEIVSAAELEGQPGTGAERWWVGVADPLKSPDFARSETTGPEIPCADLIAGRYYG